MHSDVAYAQFAASTYISAPSLLGAGLANNFAADVAIIGGVTTVCFRGSKLIRDWVADFFALPIVGIFKELGMPAGTVDHPLGAIHSGFLSGAQALYPEVLQVVAGKPFRLVGHSLGGALALVCGALLRAAGHVPAEIVTFGCPRAGDRRFAQNFVNVPVRQYRYEADPVPLVPTFPYEHPVALTPLADGSKLGDVFLYHGIVHYISCLQGEPQ